MMDWDADVITAWSVLILGVLGVLGGAIKWIDARSERRQRQQAEQLQQMATMLSRADHQLHPNSGQSMADKIDRIEAGMARLETRMDRGDEVIAARIDQLERSAGREHRSIRQQIADAIGTAGEIDQ